MLRISEVADLAGVSLPTIKYYAKEGLIMKPVKTGKTMAYYDRATVKRILIIKKLQHEKFLPLHVIKKVVDRVENDADEYNLVQTLMKVDTADDAPPVAESQIEARLDYPLKKIKILEEEGMVSPIILNDEKHYEPLDINIVEVIRGLEGLGLPFDHVIETMRAYHDAVRGAALEAMRIFARNMLGDMPLEQAVKLVSDGGGLVDRFILASRKKVIKNAAHTGMRDFDTFAKNLAVLSFLPIKGEELPSKPPRNLDHHLTYLFLKGKYNSAIHLLECDKEKCRYFYVPACILADLLRGDVSSALDTAKKHIPVPTSKNLHNMAAALAYMFAVESSKGLSNPLLLTKKAMTYLRRIETTGDSNELVDLFAKYVCGAYYSMAPDFFDVCDESYKMLEWVEEIVTTKNIKTKDLPEWMDRTLRYEIFPAMELRIHRFMIYCYLRDGKVDKALKRLDMMLRVAPPGDEFAEWARDVRFRLKQNPKANPLH